MLATDLDWSGEYIFLHQRLNCDKTGGMATLLTCLNIRLINVLLCRFLEIISLRKTAAFILSYSITWSLHWSLLA